MNVVAQNQAPAAMLAAFESELERACERICAELAKRSRHGAAGLTAAGHEVTRLVREFHRLYPAITALQQEEKSRAEAAGAGRMVMPRDWHELNTRLHHLRQALNRWPEIRALVERQMPPKRRKLYRRREHTDAALATQIERSDRLAAALGGALNPDGQSEAARALGCFGDIATPASRLVEHFHAAYRLRLAQGAASTDYLDIGCGAGAALLAAQGFFDRVAGLEYDPRSARAAQALLGTAAQGPARVVEGDAFGFESYAAFDVLYLFRPMRDDAKMQELERLVAAAARPGALLIAPYRGFAARHDSLGCPRIDTSIYLVRGSRRRATDLRRAAELIGPDVGMRDEPLTTVWTPILRQSAANGHALARTTWVEEV